MKHRCEYPKMKEQIKTCIFSGNYINNKLNTNGVATNQIVIYKMVDNTQRYALFQLDDKMYVFITNIY